MSQEKNHEPKASSSESSDKSKEAPVEDVQELTTLHERTIAALSYVGLFAIIPFYLKKDSKFCRFHGKQGMIIALIFFFAKLLFVLDFFNDLAKIVQFSIFVWMGLAALSGQWKKLPWVYNWSCELEKQLTLKTPEEIEEEKFHPKETPDD